MTISTKVQSLRKTDTGRVYAIHKFITENGAVTRTEIAGMTGISLSSVCGRCNSMITDGTIEVVGTTLDVKTNRTVELLDIKRNKND